MYGKIVAFIPGVSHFAVRREGRVAGTTFGATENDRYEMEERSFPDHFVPLDRDKIVLARFASCCSVSLLLTEF